MSKFNLVVDSSQISCFLECPQKWVNLYLKKLEPLSFQADENMNAGTYGHKLLDIYYRLKFRGTGLNSIFEQLNAYDPDKDVCECGCTKDFHCLVPGLEGIEECQRCKKCLKFRPHPFELNTKTRKKVIKRIVDYTAKYQKDDIQPLSEQHVEIGFSEPIYEDSENLFTLEGRVDLIGTLQGLDCFMDHKFQSKSHYLYNRSVQVKNYMLITKKPAAVLNYIRLHDKVEKDTLTREVITLNSVELTAWHRRLVQIFFRMKKVVQATQGKEVERNWNACSGGRLTYDKLKPQFCWYTDLCEEVDPVISERKEKALFKIKENIWRPW